MLKLYYWPTPNGKKITIFLEETGLPYEIVPVAIGKGEQFEPDFLAFSPNNKIPALTDPDGPDGKPISVFESGAILVYLAEKTGKFMPSEPRGRNEVMCWLMMQMGTVGPMMGQYNHFAIYATDKNQEYATERYSNERLRIYGVLDRRLKDHAFLAGADYSIADMATFPWILPEMQKVDMSEFPHVDRWHKEISARPAVERGMAVGSELRKPNEAMDDKAKEILFGKTQFAKR